MKHSLCYYTRRRHKSWSFFCSNSTLSMTQCRLKFSTIGSFITPWDRNNEWEEYVENNILYQSAFGVQNVILRGIPGSCLVIRN